MRMIRPTPQIWSLLAGMRFFFAFWVLSDHTYNFGPTDRAIPVFSKSGLVAVLCFLVISGFSIAHSVTTRPKGFYARRFWRIAPVNVIALCICAIGFALAGKLWANGTEIEAPGLWTWVVHALFLQSIFPPIMGAFFPSWSLSIEAVLYAIAPLLLRTRAILILISSAISCALFAAWPKLSTGYIAQAPYGYAVGAFAFAWLAGWMAYKAPRSMAMTGFFVVLGWAVINADAYGFQTTDRIAVFSTYLTWTCTVVLINFPPALSMSDRVSRILVYLGDLSFPLYLVHYPVLFLISSIVWRSYPQTNYGFVHVIVALIAADIVLRITDGKYRSTGVALIKRMVPRKQPEQS